MILVREKEDQELMNEHMHIGGQFHFAVCWQRPNFLWRAPANTVFFDYYTVQFKNV